MKILFVLGCILLTSCGVTPSFKNANLIIDEAPRQTKVSSNLIYQVENYRITQLATFEIKAKVLSNKLYFNDRQSELSPVDLVLGWKQMSDDRVLEHLNISQSNRWYHWFMDQSPISQREVEFYSANVHLIPADTHIDTMIRELRKGDAIELKGDLVRVDADDGWSWVTSLSREDRGANSCELILVKSIQMIAN